MRFGSRFNATCANVTTLGGDFLAWVGICRYLGVYLSSARTFKCCFDNCKVIFYSLFNVIAGRLGRCGSPEVIVYLLSSKCMPILLYSLDSCPTNVTDLRALEHPVTMTFVKMFKTNSIDIVSYCQTAFGFHSVREQVLRRKINFFAKPTHCLNSLCSSLSANRVASKQLLLRTQLGVSATLTLIVIFPLRSILIPNQEEAYLESLVHVFLYCIIVSMSMLLEWRIQLYIYIYIYIYIYMYIYISKLLSIKYRLKYYCGGPSNY